MSNTDQGTTNGDRAGARNYRSLLRKVYFFHELGESDLQRIEAVCHELQCQRGDIIFEEGSAADRFYIVAHGSVEVWKDYDQPERDLLAVHGAGHLFGEMALIDDLPRSATLVAEASTQLLYIDRDDFHAIIRENSSVALSIMMSVSSMVRQSNESFVDSLRQRNRELERAYRDLKDAQEEVLRAERLSTLGKFSSLVLHDIRNPLSILRGYAELMFHHADSEERVQETAQRIVREADRLNALASELLDFSRGEIRLNVSAVKLDELVSQVVEAVGDKFRARNIEIVTDVQFAGPVLMDGARMYRVLFNLADNARKAMSRGGRFEIQVQREDGGLLMSFSDTGVGMSAAEQERIFEPFISFSEEGGSGLGMAIVKSIVDAHDGSLTLTSTENGGTTFAIRMPLLS